VTGAAAWVTAWVAPVTSADAAAGRTSARQASRTVRAVRCEVFG
jgi:hypothetical protein